MQGIIIIPLLVFACEIIITFKNYYIYKGCGNIIGRYKHSSDMKIVSLTIFILTIIFFIWVRENYSRYLIDNAFLVLYVAIIMINHHRDILIVDEGIYINGRFIKWELVKDIKKYDKQSLRIELQNKWLKVQVANRVKYLDELLELVIIKMNK